MGSFAKLKQRLKDPRDCVFSEVAQSPVLDRVAGWRGRHPGRGRMGLPVEVLWQEQLINYENIKNKHKYSMNTSRF